MTVSDGESAREHTFSEVSPPDYAPREHLNLSHLKDIKMTITADLGRCALLVREVLELQEGALIQLDKLAGEMTDVYVNGLPLAKGEVVVIGDTLHVRVGEILGDIERVEESRIEAPADEEEDEV